MRVIGDRVHGIEFGGLASGATLRMINYLNWMGTNEVSNFTKRTGIHVQQFPVTSDPERVTKIRRTRPRSTWFWWTSRRAASLHSSTSSSR